MELTIKDIKKIWLTDEAVCIETINGEAARELFADYPRLEKATAAQRASFVTSEFGIHWPEIDEDLSFEGFFSKKKRYQSALGRKLAQIQELNISALARKLGIAQPLMADYLSGKKTPGPQRRREIEEGLHQLGKELLSVKW